MQTGPSVKKNPFDSAATDDCEHVLKGGNLPLNLGGSGQPHHF